MRNNGIAKRLIEEVSCRLDFRKSTCDSGRPDSVSVTGFTRLWRVAKPGLERFCLWRGDHGKVRELLRVVGLALPGVLREWRAGGSDAWVLAVLGIFRPRRLVSEGASVGSVGLLQAG